MSGCTNPVIDEFAMAARWLDHHHRHNNKSTNYNIVAPSVYDQLEEYWEDLADELAAQQSRIPSGGGLDGLAMEGGGGGEEEDIGGELYRKSREAAMRRKLLFDCVNEVLGRMARAMVKKAVAMEPCEYYCSQRSRGNGYYCQEELRKGESDGVVSVWRVIEEMEGGEGAMASSKSSSSMMMMMDRRNRKKQKEVVGDSEDLLLLMVMMMIRKSEGHHGHGHDSDDGDGDDGDEMVAIVAGQVEAEMLDSIVQDLLTTNTRNPSSFFHPP